MNRPFGIRWSAFACFILLPMAAARAVDPLPDPLPANTQSGRPDPVPSASPDAPPAGKLVKARFQRPAPLKRLTFSAKDGFSLRMVSNQDVTAEIRNGAGRTLARNAYKLEAGDWTLRPRNLPAGLYTVLLRTGPQLRSMRIRIEDSERGRGAPEWLLEKAPDSTRTVDPSAQRGAFAFPDPD
ncbi:MAG: hypothetical protein ABI036_03685 [Fibrobacteria bacterium]